MSYLHDTSPRQIQGLGIPLSSSTVKVSIIDSTTRISRLPAEICVEPRIGAFTSFTIPSFSFLIEHESKGQRLLFDLGVPKNWERVFPGPVADKIKDNQWKVEVQQDVAEVLQDHGIDPASVDAIIWSHWHWDHVGDPQTFPSSTTLLVGPGFSVEFVPGWPTNPKSRIHEKAFAGRELREVSFEEESEGLKVGGFQAHDYFGDGSFYLLNAPGHAVGHLCALARTSAGDEPTFLFMTGDAIHHGGEIRPTEQVPLPEVVSPGLSRNSSNPKQLTCPGGMFLDLHPSASSTKPFFQPAGAYNIEECKASIAKLQDFDAHEHVLCVMAHDSPMLDVAEFFPAYANEWRTKGWKSKSRWRFLGDFISEQDRERLSPDPGFHGNHS